MAGESLLNGKDFVLQIDTVTPVTADAGTEANYKTIACEVSHEFSIEKETTQVSNKCTRGWGSTTFGDKSWSMSYEGQAVDPETLEPSEVSLTEIAKLAAQDKEFWVRRAHIDGTTGEYVPYREGVVKAVSFNETSNTTDPLTFTVEFEGKGEPILEIVAP